MAQFYMYNKSEALEPNLAVKWSSNIDSEWWNMRHPTKGGLFKGVCARVCVVCTGNGTQ